MSERLMGIALGIASLMVILIMVAVGLRGLHAIETLQADELSIQQTEWKDVELAETALEYSNQNARINAQIVAAGDRGTLNSLLAQRAENSLLVGEIIDRLRGRIGSGKEGQLLNEVIQGRDAYIACYKQETRLLLENRDPEAARRWLIQDCSSIWLRYQVAWSEFINFQSDEMSERLVKSSRLSAASRKSLVSLLAVAVPLAVIICTFSIRKIMGEIRRREIAERVTRRLNEQLEMKVSRRTADLESSYQSLQVQIAERQAAEEELRQKNAFMEAQLNSTMDGILVVDEKGKKVLQNRRFRELFQLPQHVFDDDNAQSGIDYVVDKIVDPENFLHSIRQMKQHREEIVSDEVEFLDGMVIDRYSAPAVGDDGKYYGRIWVFRDVSERKRNEAEVRRLSLAVEQSPVSVMITDLSAKMIYVNRKFTECTGYSPEEVIGQNPRLLKSGHTSPEEYRRLWETIISGNEWRGEFHNRKKNGELYWEYAVITPMRDAKGNITHFLGLKEDITERRLLQSQLQRAQKLEAIGQLAAGIAHEINTPMQFIGDNTRFLQQAWVTLDKLVGMFCSLQDATMKEVSFRDYLLGCDVADLRDLQQEVPAAIEQSLDGVGRVSNIVRAMKEFSHPGSEDKQPTDINHIIENTLTVTRSEWKYVADVETTLSPDVGLVSCHRAEFNQVILNLLVNAAHAIAEVVGDGSKNRGKITIRTIRDQKGVEISIHDTGCGIPAAMKAHIFEPFFTTKEVGRGTGQGLALAHAIIVKQHNGNIWFESESGKGTTFFIRLPA